MDDVGQPSSTKAEQYSFEEFRLMYLSTELISDRKINFMRNNSSLCMAIIGGQGVAGAWAYGRPEIAPLAAVTLILISMLGAAFCLYWITQLDNLRALNGAKFEVLKEMAAQVVFPDYSKATIVSKNPFVREYEIMEKNRKLKLAEGGWAPKAKDSETVVPASFLIFFLVAALLCVYWIFHVHVGQS